MPLAGCQLSVHLPDLAFRTLFTARSDDQGRYSFSFPVEGRVELISRFSGVRQRHSANLVRGLNELDLDLRGSKLRGKVLDAPNCRVTLSGPLVGNGEAPRSSELRTARNLANGAFEFDWAPPGRYLLTALVDVPDQFGMKVSTDWIGESEVIVREGEDPDFITIRRGATQPVQIVVLDESSNVLMGAHVTIARLGRDSDWIAAGSSDSRGLVLAQVPNEWGTVVATAESYTTWVGGPPAREAAPRSFDLRELQPPDQVVLHCKPTGKMVVNWGSENSQGADERAFKAVVRNQEGIVPIWGRASASYSNSAVFRSIPPGEYTIVAESVDGVSRKVQVIVQGGEVLRVDLGQ